MTGTWPVGLSSAYGHDSQVHGSNEDTCCDSDMEGTFEETGTAPRTSPSSHNDHNTTIIPHEPQFSS